MYLKRLELTGFKTFAERTEIELEPGFLCVVGPNGSGKSNLTDALRYCLGEQSVKVMRGACLEEMIFAGTPTRRPAPFCEVTAVFDNSDGHLPVDFPEVAFTRRTTRGEDSRYQINGVDCRLRDLHELLMGSGIGPGSFSILGASEVEMVLSRDPGDRRVMLEETAGVNRYRFRKRDAERHLARTRDNLTRLRDILNEVESHRDESRRALARYRRYRAARERLGELERCLAAHDLTRVDGRLAQARIRTRQAEDLARQAEERLEALQAAVRSQEGKRRELEQRREAEAERMARLREERSRTEAACQALSQRAAELEQAARAARERLESTGRRAEECGRELEALEGDLPRAEEEARRSREELARLQEELGAQPLPSAAPGREVRDRLTALEGERSRRAGRLEALQARLQEEQRRLRQAREEAATAREDARRARQEIPDLAPCREAVELARRQEEEGADRRRQVLEYLQGLRRERAEGERRRRPAASRVSELEALVEDRAGLLPSVRRVLGWREAGTLGIVGELIRVPEELDTAVEAALGRHLQDVVTRDRQTASRLIERLKAERAGRVTFWPLDLKRRTSPPPSFPPMPGVVGRALEQISFPAELRPVMEELLGRTVFVEDLPRALALYERWRGRRPVLVTLQGEVLAPSGALTGGSMRADRPGILARRRQLEQARGELARIDREIARLHAAEEAAAQELATAEAALWEAREALRRARQTLEERSAEARLRAADARRAEARARALEQEAGSLASQIARRKEEIEEEQETLRALEQESLALREQLTRSQEEEARLQLRREELRRAVMEAERYHGQARGKAEELAREAERLRERLRELALDREAAAAELSRLAGTREELDREGRALQDRQEELAVRLAEAQAELDAARAEAGAAEARLEDLRRMQEVATRDARRQAEELGRCRVERAGLEARREEAVARLEELGGDPEELPAGFDPEAARAEAVRLRSLLEGFGGVNLGAQEEFDRLEARCQDLRAQIRDLEEGARGLLRVIAEMNRASAERFKATFHRVNATFSRIFTDLFGGGQARLELCDPGDLLESGVEIVACPPGKKLQNLALLSSGERALAAIAFLLSLLACKPSPIVMLDELDAPLDEGNVEKVASRFLEFSTSSQFLVITHNRKTMEFADRLLGVTMEEPGVSRLVSVTLESVPAGAVASAEP